MTGRYKAYSEYKDSGVRWLGSIPSHWQVIPLKHLAVLNPKKSAMDNQLLSEHCSFVPMDKLKLNSLQLDETRVISDVYDGYTYFENNDVLVAKVTPCFENKNMAVAKNLKNGVGFGSSEIYVLRTNSKLNNQFLFYRLQEDSFMDIAVAAMSGAGGLKRVPTEVINTFLAAFPNYDEQQKIANFLDHETAKIDTLITKQEKLIELLKEKRQAVISHAVTKGLNPDAPMKDSGVEWLGEVPEHWKACPLKTISKFRQGKLHEPYIHEDGKFICVNSRFVSTEGEKFKYCSKNLSPVENEDILMVMSDLPNGRALAKALFVQGDNNFALNQRVCAITATEIDARFLYYQLNRNEYFLSFDDGCNQTNLSNYVFKNFPALVPYKAEQCEIAEYLDRQTESFDRLVEIANRQIELMKERKTALISAAVTGKIDVRDWEGEA
ncbi:restriction endonuclease subunit S [Vibrio furnissii]|nr:restriction endonuclease subunit S [Vibrio parahaemolyticus]